MSRSYTSSSPTSAFVACSGTALAIHGYCRGETAEGAGGAPGPHEGRGSTESNARLIICIRVFKYNITYIFSTFHLTVTQA
jgi:hypothetical protein